MLYNLTFEALETSILMLGKGIIRSTPNVENKSFYHVNMNVLLLQKLQIDKYFGFPLRTY